MHPEQIALRKISHRYGWQWALIDLSLEVNQGESVMVMGPNGCGKSTLLKILATRLLPTQGEGVVFNRDIKREAASLRKNIEWLGHELGLYLKLTAAENLRFSFALKGERLADPSIREVLDQVGLAKWRHRAVNTFSSGMRKRLALARILLNQPKLILLDEPHANLDQEGKELMNQCIAQWKKEQVTLFLASHDHHEIAPLCDRVLLLNEGRLKHFGVWS